jgi:hypothetical protein
MTVVVWLAFLVPALVTYLTVRHLSRGRDHTLTRAVAAAIAPGVGLGFASCWYFFVLLVTRTRTQALVADASLWLVASATLAVLHWRDPRAMTSRNRSRGPDTRPIRVVPIDTVVAAAGAVGVAVLAGSALWLHHTAMPHGQWDAWAIWNLRARALLARPTDWATILSPEIGWSNPDYPLLVPLSVARLWAWSGGADTIVPGIVAMTFVASTVAGVITMVGSTRGWTAGLLSGAVLLVPQTYVYQGSCQCADVPLAFYMWLAVACVVVNHQLRETDGWILVAIAGAAAGLAAWTKNEGAVLLVAIAVFLCTWHKESRLRAWLSFAGGAAVPLVAWLWFKLFLSPPNDQLTPGALAGVTGRLMDSSRWSIIVDRLTTMIPDWGGVTGGGLLMLGIVVVLTYGADRRSIVRSAYALTIVAGMMAGYILAYAITWKPLTWHIDTSFHRLMTQVWPTLVWAAFQLSGRETVTYSVPDLKV